MCYLGVACEKCSSQSLGLFWGRASGGTGGRDREGRPAQQGRHLRYHPLSPA